jgi:translation elongation factor P/translation initiation factor 5A
VLGCILDTYSTVWLGQFDLRDLRTKAKFLERRRSYDKVEVVRLEQKAYQFLYREGDVSDLTHRKGVVWT